MPPTSPTVGSEVYSLEIPENRDAFWSPAFFLKSSPALLISRRTSSPSFHKQTRGTGGGISVNKKQTKTIQVREIGGTNSSLWTHFLDELIDVVVYVMDVTNSCQIALAVSQISSLLNNARLQVNQFFARYLML